jgi:hypothetical protein
MNFQNNIYCWRHTFPRVEVGHVDVAVELAGICEMKMEGDRGMEKCTAIMD